MEDLFFKDIKAQIDTGFVNQGWITAYKSFERGGLYSAIADIDKVDDALKSHNWEIRYGDIRPYIYDEKYCSINNLDFEPLVLCREELGQYDNYRELSEDFRLYHNLYEIYTSPNSKKYVYIDSNGDEEEVAKITEKEVFVKLKFLKDYISAKGKHFFVYFDIMRYSPKLLTELNINELNENVEKKGVYFYNHIIKDVSKDGFDKKNSTFSWIMGKVLIRKIEDYQHDGLWGNMEERGKYAEFIIDYDESGNEISFTCDEDKLGNYFGKNPDSPQYVTPVFFSKDVLKKYYDNPQKYSVEDGCIWCGSVWCLRLDNSCKDYVIVLLGDLGKNLHYKEQLYWKSYNIPPQKGGFSRTAFTRWIEGKPCNPDKADLYLKMRYSQFSKLWNEKFGWYLFKPLSEDDSHYFQTLHLLTTDNNNKEFDEQILALTKIFIDSLNEKELVKGISITKESPKGIDKFEAFLENNSLKFPEMITFFRNIQSLRSSTVAHRRSTERKDTKKVLDYFEIETNPLDKVLEEIFMNFIKTLNTLEKQLIK